MPDWIWEMIKSQGLSFVLMAIAVYFLKRENEKNQSKIESLYKGIITDHEKDKQKMIEVIINNTNVMNEIKRLIEKK